MKEFIRPDSIAIIGASAHPSKLGYRLVRNLLDSGYGGHIVPINPKGGRICGLKAYKNMREASKELGKIDLAIIVVRAEIVPKVLEDIGESGTKHVVIISSGFEEAGRKDLADQVRSIAKRYNIRIIGPNCAGIINTAHNMNASFIEYPPRGPVSMISQSGALGAALVYHMLHTGMGMTTFFSIGNMMDVTFVDLLEPVAEISGAVALYVEGIKDGRAFYEALLRAKKHAPIVALKAGRTAAGMRAAASHTGSLATQREIVKGMFKQAGVPVVDEIYELGEVANFLAKMKEKAKKPIRTLGILTNAGGGSVLSADFAEAYGIVVPELDIDVELPWFASRKNPIDVTAMGKYEEFYRVVEALERDERIDAILVINVVPTFLLTDPLEHARAVVDAYSGEKPIAAVRLTGRIAEPGRKYLEDHGIPTFSDIRTAIKGFGSFNEALFREVFMINPINNKRVLFAGPIVKHAHIFCLKEGEAYVTYDVRSHASEAYIARTILSYVDPEGRLTLFTIAFSHETHKIVHELYRCPSKRVAVARLHKDPSIELHHLHLPKDLLRFAVYPKAYSEEPLKPASFFDVRFDHINNVQVSSKDDHIFVEIHTIRSAFFGKYEKVFLRYYPERNEVFVDEEVEEIDLIE